MSIQDGANRWRGCKRRPRTGKGVSNRGGVSSNFSGPAAKEAGKVLDTAGEDAVSVAWVVAPAAVAVDRDDPGMSAEIGRNSRVKEQENQ